MFRRAALAVLVSLALPLAAYGQSSAVAQVREAVQAVVEPAPPPPADVSPLAVQHIIRWEITGAAYYNKRLRSPIWPGGASGITWCIGYDGGHQTWAVIKRDWSDHAQVARLAGTAGITGARAKAALPQYRDITTHYQHCEAVFRNATLPAYHRLAQRTFSRGWHLLPADAQGMLTAAVYNRGASMSGDRRREMRVLRDTCVPAGDTACMAQQFRSMCRIWRGTAVGTGLCNRYQEAARIAERAR